MEREKIDAVIRILAEVHIHHHHHHAPRAVSSTLTFRGGNMDASILVGQTIPAIYTEFDGPNGTGNVVPPTGLVGFTSDNTAVATVDATSGICTGVAAGTANISANDGGLAAPGLPASGVLTVTAAPPPVAVSSTLTFGAPAAAAPKAAVTVDASGAPVKGRAPAK